MPDSPRGDDDRLDEMYGHLPNPTTPVPTSRRAAREARLAEEERAGQAAHDADAGQDESVIAAASEPAPGDERRGDGSPARMPRLDDLFAEGPAPSLGAQRKHPTRRRRGRWVGGILVVVVLLAMVGGAWFVWTTYEQPIRALMGWQEPTDYDPGLAHGEALVTIVSGDTGQTISRTLATAGVTKTPEVFYDMLVRSGDEADFYPGVYRLEKQMTAKAALSALRDPATKMQNSVLIREGLTQEDILTTLAETLKMPKKDFTAAAKDPSSFGVDADSLEGWLFPALYTFEPDVDAHDILQTMVDRTTKALDDAGVPAADRERILTIASIIQREARQEKDFFKVSRVIQNRLKPDNPETHGKLQMDSTVQYGFGEVHSGSASSSAEALRDDNPWNTYVHTGLPIGPISSPGDTAIDAAMHPTPGPWLYFVTVNLDTGETVFTTTYAEHQKAVEQMRSWCSDHPDSGC